MSDGLLPDDVEAELLRRWNEPHRRYHGVSHLRAGLAVLDDLGAGSLERMAWWCHDAVHSNNTPSDELASAELARRLLAPHLTPGEVDEVCRLVLVTVSHQPAEGDARGARVADATCTASGCSGRPTRRMSRASGQKSNCPLNFGASAGRPREQDAGKGFHLLHAPRARALGRGRETKSETRGRMTCQDALGVVR